VKLGKTELCKFVKTDGGASNQGWSLGRCTTILVSSFSGDLTGKKHFVLCSSFQVWAFAQIRRRRREQRMLHGSMPLLELFSHTVVASTRPRVSSPTWNDGSDDVILSVRSYWSWWVQLSGSSWACWKVASSLRPTRRVIAWSLVIFLFWTRSPVIWATTILVTPTESQVHAPKATPRNGSWRQQCRTHNVEHYLPTCLTCLLPPSQFIRRARTPRSPI
jgi:hypothetical protein